MISVLERDWDAKGRTGKLRDAGVALALSLAIALVYFAFLNVLVPPTLFDDDYSTVLLDKNGLLLGATVASDGQWRFPPDAEVPERYVRALTTYEDKRFYFHRGVDLFGLIRALVSNIRAGQVVSGGSTLTMQVIRIAGHNPDRTFAEKLREIVLATALESLHSKTEVIRMYAAHAPFGGNVVGLEAAAWRYFGRSPQQLSWGDAATLAVLPNSPALVHPGRNRNELKQKRDRLLSQLHQQGDIGDEDYRLALAEVIPAEPRDLPADAPHALNLVRSAQTGVAKPKLIESLFSAAVNDGTQQVDRLHRLRSSIDISLQRRVNSILLRHHTRLAGNGIEHAAVLVLDTKTGRTLAYAGNVPIPENDGYWNDMIQAERSTGSLLKPFLYAAMLNDGELLPSQLVTDIPTRFGSYAPENNTKTYVGALPADHALARSLNVPAVRELRAYGLHRFYDVLKNLGLSSLFRPADMYGLPLILGGAEGNLWELTHMYADMGRTMGLASGTAASLQGDEEPGAVQVRNQFIARNAVWAGKAAEMYDPGSLWLTMDALSKVARPEEESAWEDFVSSHRIAWKTGTSFGFRDAWAIGVNPRFTIGVWVGNASGEGRPELRGYSSAAPILFDVLTGMPDAGWWNQPDDLVEVDVCADSGYLAGPNCPHVVRRLVPKNGVTSQVCPYCRIVHVDGAERYQVTAETANIADMKHEKWFVLPAYVEQYYRRANPSYRPLPPFKGGAEAALLSSSGDSLAVSGLAGSGSNESPLAIVFPQPGARIFIPYEIDGSPGMTVFEAAHRNPKALLYWHLDDDYLGSTREIHQMEAHPGPGPHRLVVVDQDGLSAERRFTVVSP